MKKNIVIIMLVIIVLGLGGYLVYDKLTLKNEKCEVTTVEDNNKISQGTTKIVENERTIDSFDNDIYYYFENYIPGLISYLISEGEKFDLTKYNNKDEDTIKRFIYTYYANRASKYNITNQEENGYSYKVSKEELDKLTYVVFNKEGLDDYSYTFRDYFGNIKQNDGTYKIVSYPTGGGRTFYTGSELFKYDNNSVSVEFSSYSNDIYNNVTDYGKIKITFKYNEEKKLYYIDNIVEVKD